MSTTFKIVSVDRDRTPGAGRVTFTDGTNVYSGEVDPAVMSPMISGSEGLSYAEVSNAEDFITDALKVPYRLIDINIFVDEEAPETIYGPARRIAASPIVVDEAGLRNTDTEFTLFSDLLTEDELGYIDAHLPNMDDDAWFDFAYSSAFLQGLVTKRY